jgi:transposase
MYTNKKQKNARVFHLTDEKWKKVEAVLPLSPPNPKGGRPRVTNRQCFEGILWILRTGAQWHELPETYGSGITCWRRLRQWEEADVLLSLWRVFLADLSDKEKIRWDECFEDGSFAPAKKGAQTLEKQRKAKVRSGWYWSMAKVLRLEHYWNRHRLRR